jgi:hypothetical protein
VLHDLELGVGVVGALGVAHLLAQVHQDAGALLQLHHLLEALQQPQLRPDAVLRQLPPPAGIGAPAAYLGMLSLQRIATGPAALFSGQPGALALFTAALSTIALYLMSAAFMALVMFCSPSTMLPSCRCTYACTMCAHDPSSTCASMIGLLKSETYGCQQSGRSPTMPARLCNILRTHAVIQQLTCVYAAALEAARVTMGNCKSYTWARGRTWRLRASQSPRRHSESICSWQLSACRAYLRNKHRMLNPSFAMHSNVCLFHSVHSAEAG